MPQPQMGARRALTRLAVMYADAASGEATTVVDDDADDATRSPTVGAA